MKNIVLIPFVLFNLAYSALSFAGCNAVGGPLTINGKDIIVNNDTPVGTLLATFSIGSMQTYSCDNNNTNNMITGGKIYGEFATTIDGIRVYKTNIAGIGYSLGVQSMCRGDMLFPAKGWKNNLNNISVCWHSHTWNQINHNFDVRIYKIGPTESGTVAKKQIGATILSYNKTSIWAQENPVFLNAFDVKTVGNSNQGGNNSNQGNNNGHQGGNNSNQGNNSGYPGGNNGNQGNNNGYPGGNNGNQGNNNGYPGGNNGNQGNNNGYPGGNNGNQGSNNNGYPGSNNGNQGNNNGYPGGNNSNQNNNNNQWDNNSNLGNGHSNVWPNNGNNNPYNNNF